MNNSTTSYEQLKAMGEACIDNTPQQVESLAKELESRSNDIHVSLVISASDSSEVRAKKFFDAVDDAIKEKAKRDRLDGIEEMMSLVSTGSIHDDFDVKWAIEKLYDAGYRKGE